MREAFGGSWLLGFVALFIVLFSAYLAVSINYTKAFKAKNKIINIIEQNEGMSKSVGDVRNKTDEELNKIIDEVINLVNPTSIKDLGKVMKEITPRVKNRCDMSKLNSILREKLN